jgi:hypothetical protein
MKELDPPSGSRGILEYGNVTFSPCARSYAWSVTGCIRELAAEATALVES